MQIDWWTFALQAINVLILLWLLKRFLFAPVAAIVARRQAEANRMLDSAQAAEHQAAQARTALAEQQAGLASEAAALRAAARAEAEKLRDEIVRAAQEEAQQVRATQKRDLERDLAAAEKELVLRAGRLATGMAASMLSRLPPAEVTEGLVSRLMDQLAALPSAQRASLLADGEAGHAVEMVTAHALSEQTRTELTARLQAALGAEVYPAWRVDPALLGGIELRSHHLALRNSWRAQLEQLEAELVRP